MDDIFCAEFVEVILLPLDEFQKKIDGELSFMLLQYEAKIILSFMIDDTKNIQYFCLFYTQRLCRRETL